MADEVNFGVTLENTVLKYFECVSGDNHITRI